MSTLAIAVEISIYFDTNIVSIRKNHNGCWLHETVQSTACLHQFADLFFALRMGVSTTRLSLVVGFQSIGETTANLLATASSFHGK